MGSGGSVPQTFDTFCVEAVEPFGNRLQRGVVPACDLGLAQPAIHYGAHHLLSTFGCQAGILVGVHSVLRESLLFGDISVPGQDRMDNLLKVHI
jgi:hypothetical protein